MFMFIWNQLMINDEPLIIIILMIKHTKVHINLKFVVIWFYNQHLLILLKNLGYVHFKIFDEESNSFKCMQ
jgi:hypothetical protein